MKRRLLKLGLLLLAGAIINVAVAWGCATWGLFGTDTLGPLDARESRLLAANKENAEEEVLIRSAIGFNQRTAYLKDSMAVSRVIEAQAKWAHKGIAADLAMPGAWLRHKDAGWPVLALSATIWLHTFEYCDANSIADSDRQIVEYGICSGTSSAVYPLMPIWPGFAINTLFYAAIVWLLFFAPFQIRRWRRIRRGICPACAYPVGTSKTCTECGNPVSAPALNN